MKTTTGRKCRFAACLLAALAAGPLPTARAEVVSLTVGIDGTCPYGLSP